MPLQNRVTPLGDLVANPARGLVHGNRGCLHDAQRRIRRCYDGRRWIACRLSFRGWRRHPLMQPGRYTELFFLDEATALAAGHRPCALCRREDYVAAWSAWSVLLPNQRGADAIDRRLHAERVDTKGARRLHRANHGELPDGAFVLHDGAPYLVLDGHLLRWTPAGYDDELLRPSARAPAVLITPPSLVALLGSDRRPQVPFLHPTAGDD